MILLEGNVTKEVALALVMSRLEKERAKKAEIEAYIEARNKSPISQIFDVSKENQLAAINYHIEALEEILCVAQDFGDWLKVRIDL